MGEATHGVKATPEQLEREIGSIRQNLGTVLTELNHRRHELTDWRFQLRTRGPMVVRVAFGLFAAVKTFQKLRAARKALMGSRPSRHNGASHRLHDGDGFRLPDGEGLQYWSPDTR